MLCISYYVIWLVIDVMTYDDVIEEQSSLYSEKDLCLKKDLLKTIKKKSRPTCLECPPTAISRFTASFQAVGR